MPDAYTIPEARFVQVRGATSAANGLNISAGECPEGKVWTVIAGYATCSVAETQDYWFALLERTGNFPIPVTNPVSFAIDPAVMKFIPLLTEGMEIKLYPGEQIHAYRDAATAGSTIGIKIRYIETDLPLYEYIEPQEQMRINKFRRGLVPGAVSPAGGGRSGSLGGVGMGGGRGGVPKPK